VSQIGYCGFGIGLGSVCRGRVGVLFVGVAILSGIGIGFGGGGRVWLFVVFVVTPFWI
jgi:hypothetical protein